MTKSYLRGHKIELVDDKWTYCDTGSSTANDVRPCGYCNKENTPEGHDGCLGTLPGVMNACCGHGEILETYVQFLDGHSIHGDGARKILDVLTSQEDLTRKEITENHCNCIK